MVITDVDGVLTDGGMYYAEQGDELKRFNVRDGVGVVLLQAAGIRVGAMTGESTPLVTRRLEKIGVEFLFHGVKDKRACLRAFLDQVGGEPEQVAYVGDEINDLCLIDEVGLFFAVADGNPEVRRRANVVLETRGGDGPLREVAWRILESRGEMESALASYRKRSEDQARAAGANGCFVEFRKQLSD